MYNTHYSHKFDPLKRVQRQRSGRSEKPGGSLEKELEVQRRAQTGRVETVYEFREEESRGRKNLEKDDGGE